MFSVLFLFLSINAIVKGDISTHSATRSWTWPTSNRVKFIDTDKSFFPLFKHKYKILVVEKVPTTPSPSGDCICVPYYQCNSNNTIITDGIGIIDVRIRRCTGDLEVCCKLLNLMPRPPPPSMASIVTPTFIPTAPPTQPATEAPTQPPTQPPTPPPTEAPTSPPTQPPTPPPTEPPTPPPTLPPTQPPTEAPTQPPTPPPTQPPTPPPTSPPTSSAPITALPTFPPYPCICVDSSLCDSNGFLLIAGEGIINPRQTQYPCPLASQICCRVSTNSISFPSTAPGTITTTTISPLPQQNTCVCVKVYQCNPNGIVIISGAGILNPRYPNYRQGQLGVCSQDETCCGLQQQQQYIPVGFPTGTGVANPGEFNPRANFTGNQITNGVVKNPGTPMACICVKAFMCPVSNIVVVDPSGIIDSRFRFCLMADEVCCRPQGIQNMMEAILPGSNFVVIQNGVVSSSSGIVQTACGVPGPGCAPGDCPTGLGETYFAEFPWMVAIVVRKDGGSSLFLCGGSMINNRAVLTAAHCVLNRERGLLVARFGEWNTADNAESLPYQESEVQSIVTHPNYYKDALYHDVALLILSKPVQPAINVQPICLPQQGMIFPPGLRCLATGWGRSGFEGQYQSTLKKIDLPLVEVKECEKRLRSTRLGVYFQLHRSFLCAGGEADKDTCTGDGGGPLVCPTASGQYIQVGIVSWGIGCGASDVPAVYADVAQHRQWIDQQLANYGVS